MSKEMVEGIKERKHDLDRSIAFSLFGDRSVHADTISKEGRITKNIVWNRLEVFVSLGYAEHSEEDPELLVLSTIPDQKYKRLEKVFHEELTMPISAKELSLSPREQLVLSAINYLRICTRHDIVEYLQLSGDHIVSEQAIHGAILNMKHLGIIREVAKKNVPNKTYGKSKYYRSVEDIEVVDPIEDLIMWCKEKSTNLFPAMKVEK